MSNPIEDAQNAYNTVVSQASELSAQLNQLQAQGVVWNDPKYQQVQQQYNYISSLISPAYQLSKDTQNLVLGITGSSGPAITRSLGQSANEQTNLNANELQNLYNQRSGQIVNVGQSNQAVFSGAPTYVQALANQGISVTPVGNLLPSGAVSGQSVQSNYLSPLPTSLAGNTPYNEMVNAMNRARDQVGFNQIVQSGTVQRPGYYGLASEGLGSTRTIGDQQTQQYQRALASFGVALGTMGLPTQTLQSEQNRTAIALEYQRASSAVPGISTRETQYYSGELQKLLQRPIEKASEYHYVSKSTGVPTPANPYELQSDISVELLKGAPTKSSEMFSPISGYTSMLLPGGQGVQQVAWQTAIKGESPQVSFLPALGLFAAAEGKYGPYGTLYGGPNYVGTPSSEGIRRQEAFVLTPDVVAKSYEAIKTGSKPQSIEQAMTIGAEVLPRNERLVGGGKVASVPVTEQKYPSTPAGYEAAMAAGVVPKPFVSGTVTKPTGEVFGYKIPVVSDILAFVSPSTFVSGRATSVTEVNPRKTGGLDYANVFIQPETQQPTRTLIEKVGGPTALTSINPDTGKLETTITQELKTTTLPETKTVFGFTGVQQKSGYDQFLDENFRRYIPDVKTGETALRIATAANPISSPSVVSSAILERVAPDKAAAAQYFEPLKGQYALFYERPETAVTSAAVGGAFGLGTRGLSAVASRFPILAEASPAVAKVGGAALGALYGGTVVYESTGGLKDFSAEAVGRIKARAVQEAYPMAIGFGAGYALPETVGTARASYAAQTATPYNRIQYMSNEAAVLGGGKPFRLESGRMSSYEQLKTEPQKYVPTAKLGDYTPLPQYAKDIKAPSFMEPIPQVRVIKEVSAKVEAPAPVKRAFVLEQNIPRESVLTTTKKIPSIPEPFTGSVEPVSTPQRVAGTSQVLILEQKPVSQIKTIDLEQETQILQVGKSRMMETVSASTQRARKATEESGTLFGVGLRNIQRASGKIAAKETLGQMKTQKQLPMVEGVAEMQFKTTANVKERSLISMRDALTRASYVQMEAVKSGLMPLLATTPSTSTALTSTQKTKLASLEEAKTRLKIPIEEVGKPKPTEPVPTYRRVTPIEEVGKPKRIPPTTEFVRGTSPEPTRRSEITTTPRIITDKVTTYIPRQEPPPPPIPPGPEPPIIKIPVPPIVPGWGATSTPQGGRVVRRGVFTELFRVGTGIGQIRITRQQRATPQRSIGVSAQNLPQGQPKQKKPRKLRF